MNPAPRDRRLALVYAAAIFTSAFLLFQIQPLISKHILPWFGGSPAVWTTCLLFFQTLLFAGYAYAHASNTWLQPRHQAIFHSALILFALMFIHILPGPAWEPRGGYDPSVRILIILAISVGLPYFVLSATGPLLQAWFARSFPGRPPYRLYALSNVGSLLALVSYPFFFERVFDVPRQATIWSAGFVVYAMLCGYAAWRILRVAGIEAPPNSQALQDSEPSQDIQTQPPCDQNDQSPTLIDRALWLLLPAFASLVLLATTNHVTIDVAAVPLLWIAPLALYLVTFIIAFDRPGWYRPTLIAIITLAAVYVAALTNKKTDGPIHLYDCGITGQCLKTFAEYLSRHVVDLEQPPKFELDFAGILFVNLIAMFGICMFCHGELARRRPAPRYLTSYYLMIAAGGALGGVAVSLIAPDVFDTYFEWKAAMFVAAVIAVGVILHTLVRNSVGADAPADRPPPRTLVPRILLIALLLPMSMVLLDLVDYLSSSVKDVRFRERNFFGTLTIRERDPDTPQIRNYVLLNGTIVHGSQYIAPQFRPLPTSYYSTISGFGRAMHVLRTGQAVSGLNIGVVGLGTGTVAAYALPGDYICFYDINPAVIDVVNSGQFFTYVRDCRARGAICDIKLGDARLMLAREESFRSPPHLGEGLGEGLAGPARYHMLVLDAFSGDAIPTHLLTLEAFQIYLRRLTTEKLDGLEGVLAVHVSNRYLDLKRVVRAAAGQIGIEAVEIDSQRVPEKSINAAAWILMTHNKTLLAQLARFANEPTAIAGPPILWTDAHTSLIEVIK
jgi:hypothetical protein